MSDQEGYQFSPLVDGGFGTAAFQAAGDFSAAAEMADNVSGIHDRREYSMLNMNIKDAVPEVPYAYLRMETMGDRIRLLREARRLTQEQLAKIVGVTKSAISQWEDGSTQNIKLEPFLRLCEALTTDAVYLVRGANRQPPSRGGSSGGTGTASKRSPGA